MIVNPPPKKKKKKKTGGFFCFKNEAKNRFSGEKDFPRELIEIWVDFNFRDFFLSKPDFCSSSMIYGITRSSE